MDIAAMTDRILTMQDLSRGMRQKIGRRLGLRRD